MLLINYDVFNFENVSLLLDLYCFDFLQCCFQSTDFCGELIELLVDMRYHPLFALCDQFLYVKQSKRAELLRSFFLGTAGEDILQIETVRKKIECQDVELNSENSERKAE